MPSSKLGLIWPFAGSPVQTEFMRTDQGWDLQLTANKGENPVYCAYGGYMTTAHEAVGVGFGPNYPVIMFNTPQKLGDGNTANGIYYGHTIAEDIKTNVQVTSAQQIAHTTNPSQGNADSIAGGGWLEIGYWGPHGPIGNGAQMKIDLLDGQTVYPDFTSGGGVPADNTGTGTGTGNDGSGTGTGNSDTSAQDTANFAAYTTAIGPELNDPRSNLPFSPLFFGMAMGGAGSGGRPFSAGGKPSYPSVNLVRGGMSEILSSRPGGLFQVFFMMNPQSIAATIEIDSSVSAPVTFDAPLATAQTFLSTAQSISFTVQFNRMYEVWKGNQPGPSQEGCRWDIRAIERLLGLYDNMIQNVNGLGINETGQQNAQGLPIQVVFGGPNSLQFQGRIMQFDYTYTRFDINMIPIEATADIQVMRAYNPPSTTDMVTGLVQTPAYLTTAGGPYVSSISVPHGFNPIPPTVPLGIAPS